MGFINKPHTFSTMPGISPDIGLKIDQTFDVLYNEINGALDDANLDGTPPIVASKLNLAGTGFLPLVGGDLTNTLAHLFAGIWRRMGASGTDLVYEYRDTAVGVLWGISYNAFYNGAAWERTVNGTLCLRLEMAATGMLRVLYAPPASGTPAWGPLQVPSPIGGSGALGDIIITSNQTVSGIFHYKNLTINAGVTWTIDPGKLLIICAREAVIINGTIMGNGAGAVAGAARSTDGPGNPGGAGPGGGGGGGGGADGAMAGGVGGLSTYAGFAIPGGSAAAEANGGTGGGFPVARIAFQLGPTLLGGGGGGGGGWQAGGTSPSFAGGNGGGVIVIEAPIIIIGGTGIISCKGLPGGGPGISGGGGAGGGGGGGVVAMRAMSYTNNGTVSATGAAGGAGSGGDEKAGGPGGAGIVSVDVLG